MNLQGDVIARHNTMMIFQELFKVFIEGLEVLQYQTEFERIKKEGGGNEPKFFWYSFGYLIEDRTGIFFRQNP